MYESSEYITTFALLSDPGPIPVRQALTLHQLGRISKVTQPGVRECTAVSLVYSSQALNQQHRGYNGSGVPQCLIPATRKSRPAADDKKSSAKTAGLASHRRIR